MFLNKTKNFPLNVFQPENVLFVPKDFVNMIKYFNKILLNADHFCRKCEVESRLWCLSFSAMHSLSRT